MKECRVRRNYGQTVPVAPSTIACSDQAKGDEDEAAVGEDEEVHKPLIARSREGNCTSITFKRFSPITYRQKGMLMMP